MHDQETWSSFGRSWAETVLMDSHAEITMRLSIVLWIGMRLGVCEHIKIAYKILHVWKFLEKGFFFLNLRLKKVLTLKYTNVSSYIPLKLETRKHRKAYLRLS